MNLALSIRGRLRKSIAGAAAVVMVSSLVLTGLSSPAAAASGGGFDQYGYNYTARLFNGTYLQWCAEMTWTPAACATFFETYGGRASTVNDQLIMKWNAAWDACNASYLLTDANGDPTYPNGDPTVCAGAWINNEVNGMVPSGDGTMWLYKIVYNLTCADPSNQPTSTNPYPPLPNGGYCTWGAYEVIMDQGSSNGLHTFNALATPNGYGTYK